MDRLFHTHHESIVVEDFHAVAGAVPGQFAEGLTCCGAVVLAFRKVEHRPSAFGVEEMKLVNLHAEPPNEGSV